MSNDVHEEAQRDESTRLGFGNSTGLQVEQVFVVQSPGCTCVAGSRDVTGFDLEVGNRIGARAVGQNQVSIRLVGVRAGRIRSNEDIPHPDSSRSLAVQSALVQNVGFRLRRLVVHEDLMFDMTSAIGEVEAVGFDARTDSGQCDCRVHALNRATQGNKDVVDVGVLVDSNEVRRGVNGAVIPFVKLNHSRVGTVVRDYFDVFRERDGTVVLDNHRAMRVCRELEHKVPCANAVEIAMDNDRVAFAVAVDEDVQCVNRRRPGSS